MSTYTHIAVKSLRKQDLVVRPARLVESWESVFSHEDELGDPVFVDEPVYKDGFRIGIKAGKEIHGVFTLEDDDGDPYPACWEFDSQQEAEKFIKNFNAYKKTHPTECVLYFADVETAPHWEVW